MLLVLLVYYCINPGLIILLVLALIIFVLISFLLLLLKLLKPADKREVVVGLTEALSLSLLEFPPPPIKCPLT